MGVSAGGVCVSVCQFINEKLLIFFYNFLRSVDRPKEKKLSWVAELSIFASGSRAYHPPLPVNEYLRHLVDRPPGLGPVTREPNPRRDLARRPAPVCGPHLVLVVGAVRVTFVALLVEMIGHGVREPRRAAEPHGRLTDVHQIAVVQLLAHRQFQWVPTKARTTKWRFRKTFFGTANYSRKTF